MKVSPLSWVFTSFSLIDRDSVFKFDWSTSHKLWAASQGVFIAEVKVHGLKLWHFYPVAGFGWATSWDTFHPVAKTDWAARWETLHCWSRVWEGSVVWLSRELLTLEADSDWDSFHHCSGFDWAVSQMHCDSAVFLGGLGKSFIQVTTHGSRRVSLFVLFVFWLFVVFLEMYVTIIIMSFTAPADVPWNVPWKSTMTIKIHLMKLLFLYNVTFKGSLELYSQ